MDLVEGAPDRELVERCGELESEFAPSVLVAEFVDPQGGESPLPVAIAHAAEDEAVGIAAIAVVTVVDERLVHRPPVDGQIAADEISDSPDGMFAIGVGEPHWKDLTGVLLGSAVAPNQEAGEGAFDVGLNDGF